MENVQLKDAFFSMKGFMFAEHLSATYVFRENQILIANCLLTIGKYLARFMKILRYNLQANVTIIGSLKAIVGLFCRPLALKD